MTTVPTHPIAGQKVGTSGLRRKTRDWMGPHFLENYVQAIINALDGVDGKRFVVGGDGRFYNTQATQIILRMLAANGAAEVIVGQNALLSTPAASHLIRLHQADGGLILSASHNAGGIDADFGLKLNLANGGPAPEAVTGAIYAQTQTMAAYHILEADDIDLTKVVKTKIGGMKVTVVDPVADYTKLMQEIFYFNAIRDLLKSEFKVKFDAMHAVTGPYARALFEDDLGAPAGTVMNAVPLPDFAGGHPDPNPIWAHELMGIMAADDAPEFGAASDGDGDRNMIVGRGAYVTPSDSLAVLAANAHLVPAYRSGLAGVARSMPTSAAVDRVAAKLGIPVFETPTGWKFFGTLLDHGKITLCGEESAGTGSDHIREKDGLWAVLLWLNILAVRRVSVADLMADHWASYGRNYYSRHDFEGVPVAAATAVMDNLRAQLPDLAGQRIGPLTVTQADEFSYQDPVDGSRTEGQGIRIMFDGGARAVFRLSGTGTQGATLRVYLETLETRAGHLQQDPQAALAPVIAAAHQLSEIERLIGRVKPDVIT